MTTTEVALAVVAVVLGGGAFGQWVGKLFPQREGASKKRSDRIGELEQAREQDRQGVADCKNDLRILSDYVHDLREHIVNEKPPPPPDWPSGLRL